MYQKILTVIIPMYNSRAYIKKCLDSFLLEESAMEQLEIIVVNDGSTDGCEVLVEGYVEKYPQSIRLLHKQNGGHGSAVNAALEVCTGKYLKVVDADDWVLTEGLGHILDILQRAASADVVVTGYQIYDIGRQSVENVLPFQEEAYKYLGMDEVVKHWNHYRRLFWMHGMAYAADFYRRAGRRLPEKVFYEDNYFVAVPAGHAEKICYIPQLFYVYRVGDANQSISPSRKIEQIGSLETVILAMCDVYAAECGGLGDSGRQFWSYKMSSVLSGYFFTVFLQFGDRRQGRKRAKDMMDKVRQKTPVFYQASKRQYLLLSICGKLPVNEMLYRKLVEYRNLSVRQKERGRLP